MAIQVEFTRVGIYGSPVQGGMTLAPKVAGCTIPEGETWDWEDATTRLVNVYGPAHVDDPGRRDLLATLADVVFIGKVEIERHTVADEDLITRAQ